MHNNTLTLLEYCDLYRCSHLNGNFLFGLGFSITSLLARIRATTYSRTTIAISIIYERTQWTKNESITVSQAKVNTMATTRSKARKNADRGRDGGSKWRSNETPSTNGVSARRNAKPRTGGSGSLLVVAGGVLLAVASNGAYMFLPLISGQQCNPASDGDSCVAADGSSTNSSAAESGRLLVRPAPGSWTDGFYTTDTDDVGIAATHALLYPNGGDEAAEEDENGNDGNAGLVEPDLVAFATEDEFAALGRVYNDRGQIVQSPRHMVNSTALYRGPDTPGTHFQWPAVEVGYKRAVPGLVGGNGEQVEIETLSEPNGGSDPRVFYVHNFLSEHETQALIDYSTDEKNPYKMARSTGGTHKAWNQGGSENVLSTRTSMNAFDVTTATSREIRQRAFRLLRMGAYQDSMADGIQILRYELGQAYISHHDYFPPNQSDDFNWDPAQGGSNRFATVFLYLSDVEYGGQTVFPQTDALTADKSEDLVRRLGKVPTAEDLNNMVHDADFMQQDSWEDKLIHQCYARFAVPPRRGDAILFYSQRPDGELDPSSLHGACPVLQGTKWGANLWVWNACRYSQCNNPLQPGLELPDELKAPFPGPPEAVKF